MDSSVGKGSNLLESPGASVDTWLFGRPRSRKMRVLFLQSQSQKALAQLEENNSLNSDVVRQDVPTQ